VRLLFVLPEYLPQEGGGLITFYKGLLPQLVRQGHSVHVLVGSGVTAGVVDAAIDGVQVRFLPPERLERSLRRFEALLPTPEIQRHLAAAWALWELADGGVGYDVVETTDWGLLFVPWVVAPNRPPLVVQLHGSVAQIAAHDPLRGQELSAILAQLVEHVGLVGAEELQTYATANARWWEERLGRQVHVLLPGLESQEQPSFEGGGTAGLVVGRVQLWKGPDVLCEAVALLGDRCPPFAWVGRDTVDGATGGSFAARLTRRYPHVWGSRVRPLGAKGFADTAALLRQAALVVVPSRWDVFNFVVVEAMAAGVPVVVSTGAGASQLVEDGRTGFTVPAGDAEALARAIQRVTALAPQERRALVQAAYETVRQHLDPAATARQRVLRYQALAAGTIPRAAVPAALRAALSPGQPLADPLAFLFQQPLRGLLSHVGKRLWAKVRRR